MIGSSRHGLRPNVGAGASGVELRGPDGGTIATFERVRGHDPNTRVDPSGLPAIIAGKPRIRGESPIRGDFPENARVPLDRMNGGGRRGPIGDIRRVCSVGGLAAATRAASMIIEAGRRPDASSIDQPARRVSQSGPAANGRDLKRYDTCMEERWAPAIRKNRARGADGPGQRRTRPGHGAFTSSASDPRRPRAGRRRRDTGSARPPGRSVHGGKPEP